MTYEDASYYDLFQSGGTMRLNYRQLLPDSLSAMLGLEHVANAGLPDARLLDLVKTRASQLNGCAFCLRLHSREAREQGETDDRLDVVAVWREADCFGRAERAALAWCEALTLLPGSGAPDELFEELRHHRSLRLEDHDHHNRQDQHERAVVRRARDRVIKQRSQLVIDRSVLLGEIGRQPARLLWPLVSARPSWPASLRDARGVCSPGRALPSWSSSCRSRPCVPVLFLGSRARRCEQTSG
jgi:AhpD family alkylhydroperoxidase